MEPRRSSISTSETPGGVPEKRGATRSRWVLTLKLSVGLALGVAVFAIAAELGLRAVGYGAVSILTYGRSNYASVLPEIGYAGRPNLSGKQAREGMSSVSLNSFGFNDTEHSFQKPDDVFRIVVLGNSYTMSNQVERRNNYVNLLESELSCLQGVRRRIEIINLGLDGSTIHQQYLLLRDFGAKFSPDLVVVQVNPFMLPGDLDPLANFSPRLEVNAEGELKVDYSYLDLPAYKLKSSPQAAFFQRVTDASRLLQYLYEYKRTSAQSVAPGPRGRDPLVVPRYRTSRDLAFKELSRVARQIDAALFVAIVPDADGKSDAARAPGEDDPDWASAARNTGVSVFDFEDESRAFVRANHTYLHGFGAQAGSGHLNHYGHAFFARQLGRRVCEVVAKPRS